MAFKKNLIDYDAIKNIVFACWLIPFNECAYKIPLYNIK